MKNLNLCLGLFVCLIGIENSYGFLQNYRGKLYTYEYINIYGVEYLLNGYMKIKITTKKKRLTGQYCFPHVNVYIRNKNRNAYSTNLQYFRMKQIVKNNSRAYLWLLYCACCVTRKQKKMSKTVCFLIQMKTSQQYYYVSRWVKSAHVT